MKLKQLQQNLVRIADSGNAEQIYNGDRNNAG
jgi:hypothetical protein